MNNSLVLLAALLVGGAVGNILVAQRNDVRRTITQNRIVGGAPVDIRDWNYIISLHRGTAVFRHVCAGSILTNYLILSAAHCFDADDDANWSFPALWRARAGSSNQEAGGVYVQLVNIVKHQEYDPNSLDGNIALIRLTEPLIISPTIGQATIPPQGAVVVQGTVVRVAGWGASTADGPNSPTLQYTDVVISNRQDCFNAYLPWGGISPRMFCAGWPTGGRDACGGDGGGPLIVDSTTKILYGIVSWGNDCALAEFPGVYTSVSSYTDWIVETASTV